MSTDEDRGSSAIMGRLLVAAVIIIISLISYFGHSEYNPITHKNQHVGGMTAQDEIALGQQSAKPMADQYGGIDGDPRRNEEVDSVGRQIIENSDAGKSPYEFQFHVLADNQTINAFALPGGQIFITDGLLRRLKTPGQLAGVLGHEIGHVVDRHGAQHLAKERLTQGIGGAAVIATYDPNNPSTSRNVMLAQAIEQLITLKFGRNDELEADRLGVHFMSQAGYDPHSMLDVMEILREASQGGAPPEFFSTHPDPGHREERIKVAIEKEFPQGVPDGLKK
ncbi:MAG TPA: M48 family metalloprotease [Pirellulales bacterium]|nr:M48 family metalloprotease [Pirellulales bacterium]